MKNRITALPVFQRGCRSTIPLLIALMVVSTALVTLCIREHVGIYADAGTISGAPTLSADTVNQIFARAGSPMAGTGATVEQAARATGIDDAFALGVWWTETNDGEAGVGLADLNPGSVRGDIGFPAAYDGYTIYPSYTAAIKDWFQLLRNNYLNRGYTTAYAISYPYVGTSGAPDWAGKVVAMMAIYHEQFSQPIQVAPVPTPTPAGPTPRRLVVSHTDEMLHRSIPLPVDSERHHSVREWSLNEKASQPLSRPHQPAPVPANTSTAHSTLPALSESIQVLQALVMGTLIALLSVSIVGLGLRRRRLITAQQTTAMERTTEGLASELTTEQLSLQSIKEAMQPVPPTPRLPVIGAVPLTPLMHGGHHEIETEGFALPRELRCNRHAQRISQARQQTIQTQHKTGTEGMPVITGELTLPSRNLSEAGIEAQGLLSRYRHSEQKNSAKNC